MTKKNEEIMEILEAFDLTRCARSAAELAGTDHKTVQRYVGLRDAGHDPLERARRARLIDAYMEKVEELVETSKGKVRADVVHDRLRAMGYEGTERTTRRAVHKAKAAYRNGNRRTYRPWIPEPGKWMQFDWAWGPVVGMRQTYLFCAWLAWSRYRVVIPTWDKTLGTVLVCLDRTLRKIGAVPTYALTDNERTVSMDRIAGVSVRHPQVVAFGGHYGLRVVTCVPADPESKGGSESTVRVAKADLVPTECNLLPAYASFSSLLEACDKLGDDVNGRQHRESRRIPAEALKEELALMHQLPTEPYTAALGENPQRSRQPDHPLWLGVRTHCRDSGWTKRSGVGSRARSWSSSAAMRTGCAKSSATNSRFRAGPAFSMSTIPAIRTGELHCSRSQDRRARPSATSWLSAKALKHGSRPRLHQGVTRIRAKMSRATELAMLLGSGRVNQALSRAAHAGRFGENDLASILGHVDSTDQDLVVADERFSAQRGTKAWEVLGR